MKKSVFLIVTLIFLGFSTVNLIAQPKEEMKMRSFKDRMATKLNLSEEQKTSIEGLKIQHQKELIDLKSKLAQTKLELKELKFKGNYSREQYLSKIREQNDIRNQIAIANAEHRMDVYEQLNDEQKAIWNKMGDGMKRHKGMMREKMMKRKSEL